MKNINLSQYDLKKLLRNPALIHKIQDNLVDLKGDSLFANAIRAGAISNPQGAIKMIADQYRDNPKLVVEIVGKETMEMIFEYEGMESEDDLKGLF